VYDYVEGKKDWLAAGLPTVGTYTERPSAGDVARKDTPTCRLDERIETVSDRVRAAGWDACVVVNEGGIVFGLLREAELRREDVSVEVAMLSSPSTFRPHVPIGEMADYMVAHDLPTSPITSSDGRLIGILRREDALLEARVHGAVHEAADEAQGSAS
jgi:CBS domain-containing protein